MLTLGYKTDPNIKQWSFPGGERGIVVQDTKGYFINLKVRLNTSDRIMDFLLFKDSIKRLGAYIDILRLGYLPYARQDRVTELGASLSVKVLVDLIDGTADSIHILDPHSDVGPALFTKSTAVIDTPYYQFNKFIVGIDPNNIVIVIPDIGATKRCHALMKHFGIKKCIQLHKERDPQTGDILKTSYLGYSGPIAATTDQLIVFDDICDGGKTFIEAAKLQIPWIAFSGRPWLFVSHGIFSKGATELKQYYDRIGCTNTCIDEMPGVEIFDW